MAGAHTQYGCLGLDMSGSLTVHYDANIGGHAAKVRTSFVDRVMQMTTGCALAVVITCDKIQARSFITIKNGSQWLDFAASNTEALQSLINKAAEQWKTYEWLNDRGTPEFWKFNIRGYVMLRGELWVTKEGEWTRQLDNPIS